MKSPKGNMMIKKLLFFVMFFAAVLWAQDDDNNLGVKSAVIKLQTQVGETAVNNVLKAYFVGKYVVPVKDKGNINITLNGDKFGIDIQENDDVVFGYDLTITSDFQSSLSQISGGRINGELNINGAISAKTVKRTIENAVEKTKNAVVVLLDLNSVVEKILNKHGIKEVPIMSAIKDFFVKKESQIDGKIELWRQDYSTLLNAYVNKVENNFDLRITDMNLGLALENDNIVVNFEVVIQSERQRFWFEGEFSDYANMTLKSNKEFQVLEACLVNDLHKIGADICALALMKCSNVPEDRKILYNYNIRELCGTPPKTAYLYGYFRVKTQHGGILLFSRRIK